MNTYEFGANLEWVWREFGKSFFLKKKRNMFENYIKQRFLCLEILQTHSKFAPNSFVFIFSVLFFLCYFCVFEKEEWVWSEFGDPPDTLQTRSKLICVFLLFHFWKRGLSLEWVWRFSKLSPNSYVFMLLFFLEKMNEFGVSLEILQTLSKLTPNSLQTLLCFLLFHFWGGKEEEFGVSSEILQTLSKLAPNANDFIFLMFSLYCFFHFCLEKTNDFGVSWEVLQTLSKLICFFCFYILHFCSYSAGTWNYIFWPLFYWNISNKPCARISPGAAKLVQVITLHSTFLRDTL